MSICFQLRLRQSISSLHPLPSVSHWLKETNNRIQGSEDIKVLKQHKECLQACHKGLVGLKVFPSSSSPSGLQSFKLLSHLQLHSRVTAPGLGPSLPSPIAHTSLSQPPPFHRYHLGSVKAARPKEVLLRSHNQTQKKTHHLTGWWPPPVQHLICRSPQFQ